MLRPKILVVTDRKMEDYLIRGLIKIYNITSDYDVWSYNQDLYTIYDWLMAENEKNFNENKFLDIIRKYEEDKQKQFLCLQNYTHIILSYSFITLDYRYNIKKLERLFSYFNRLTGNGKLFINYPSAEAFYHTEEFQAGDFERRVLRREQFALENYRLMVGQDVGFSNWSTYSEDDVHEFMMRNLKKAYWLQGQRSWGDREQEEYNRINFNHLMQKIVMRFHTTSEMEVLCTSLFFILEMVGVKKKEVLKVFKE